MALNGLPNETLAHAAAWSSLSDLLALRAVSPAGRDAVKLAVPCHRMCGGILNTYSESLKGDSSSRPTKIEALGRVFGSGCDYIVTEVSDGMGMEAALRSFVASTNRRLTAIHIGRVSMSADSVREICKSSPQLTALRILRGPRELADDCAEEIGRACPLLKMVWLPRSAESPAESWAMHFPKQMELNFSRDLDEPFYEPTNYTQIEESAKQCLGVSMCKFSDCVVNPPLAACLLRTPLPSTVTRLEFSMEGKIASSTVLTLARGFHELVSLVLPWYFEHTPTFYDALFEARPEINTLKLELKFMDDACLARACQFRLIHLHLEQCSQNPGLSEAYVDMIIASPCRQTLGQLLFTYVDMVDAAQILRLVEGCPSLTTIIWKRCSAPLNGKDADIIAAIEAVLSRRRMCYGTPGSFRLEEDPDRFSDEA
jgi:hypothetical protein